MDKVIDELNRRVAESREDLLKFFFDIVAIPSIELSSGRPNEYGGEDERR